MTRYEETLEYYKTKTDLQIRLEAIAMTNRAMWAMECVLAAQVVLKSRAAGFAKRKTKRKAKHQAAMKARNK